MYRTMIFSMCKMRTWTDNKGDYLEEKSTAWMDLQSIILGKISHVVNDKYHMISPIIVT